METIVALLPIFGIFAFFALLDLLVPARSLPSMRLWRLKGLAFLVTTLAISVHAPLVWDDFLGEHRLFDGSGLGTWGGAAVGVLAVQFVSYWYHRSLHGVPLLWRSHQLHHSAERIDVFGAFYLHPFDVLGFTLMGSLGLVWIVGVTPEAAGIAGLFGVFLSIFQHSNLRTPRWLGYLVQRPENHALHHQRGLHAYNYGDIAIWDMVFGTFRNPARWEEKAGYYDGASARLGEMLMGRDVTEPPRRKPVTRELHESHA